MTAAMNRRVQDNEPVPRHEFNGLINLMVPRLERMERLCFEDEEHRPSLETLITKVDTHINVLCTWARGIKYVTVGLGTLAGSFMGTLHLLQNFGFFK